MLCDYFSLHSNWRGKLCIVSVANNVSNVYAIIQTPTLPSNFKDFAIRVIIFEVTFYIIISIVGINIIYAIVVDTFIELREEVCSQIHMYVENYFVWQVCINMYLCTYFFMVCFTYLQIWQINRDNKQICFICQTFSSKFEKKAKVHI